ncbi:MAG TPA: hypothetical protein VIN65_03315 [Candidatus Dormibacteraeota bacterium]
MNLARAIRGRRIGADDDARRSQRVAEVLGLIERFVYDLGLLIAGCVVDLHTYVEMSAASRLRSALEPARTVVGMVRPDFGEYAQVRIEGDLLDLSASVRAVVEFDDRSTRSDGPGGSVARSRRRIRVRLVLDPGITTVLDHRIEVM